MSSAFSSKVDAVPGLSRGESTRANIIAVAKQLFSEHGYHSTGLRDIQAATGLSKGAFYHHFRSKEELALAILESARCDYAEKLYEPAMSLPSPGVRLAALLDRVLELNSDPRWLNCQMMATLCAELTGASGQIGETVRSMQLAMASRWRELITAAQESGEVDPAVDPQLWSHWIVQTFIGLLLARKLGTAQVPPQSVIAQIKSILLKSTRSATRRAPGARPVGRNRKDKNRKEAES